MDTHDNILDFFQYYVKYKDDILMTYTGPFDKQVLSIIGKNIEAAVADSPRASKKIFSIFIELAQNISFYSAETYISNKDEVSGVGTLLIQEDGDYFNFMTGNMANTKKIQAVLKKCETINSLDREGLRAFKRESRQLPRGTSGGANIGLIQVALTADKPLGIRLIPVDEENSFFTLSVQIEK